MVRSMALALAALVLACSGNGHGGKIAPPDGGEGDKTGGGDISADACTPICEGRECGDDGCGGLCGQCAVLVEQCGEAGQCEPYTCKSSKDCPDGLVCAEELGQCVGCVEDADCAEGLKCAADHACHEEHSCDSDKDCQKYDMVCDKDAGKCVECLKTEHCAGGEYCKEGYCLETLCVPSESRCEAEDVLVCAEDGGGWSVSLTCLDGQYCDGGECKDYVCPPSEEFCDGEVLKECSEDGKSTVSEDDCAAKQQHCFSGACIDSVCIPNQKFCADNVTAATCLADGMAFSTLACEAQQFCQLGECKAWLCEPGKATCEGDTASVCNSLGSGYASQTNCKTQQKVCSDGKCLQLACAPSTNFCVDGDTLGHCAADGLSSTTEDCPAKSSCKDGQCLPWQCPPNSPVCADDLATKCDPLGLGPVAGGTDCSKNGKFCSEGVCVSCVPKCDGTLCGDDGCGGVCSCDDGDQCTLDQCSNGYCLHLEQPGCCSGDWECDDGNPCTANICKGPLGCTFTPVVPCCGNKTVDAGEQCDDGNDTPNDGCDACKVGPPVEKTWIDKLSLQCDPDFPTFLQEVADLLPDVPVNVKIHAKQVWPMIGDGVGEVELEFPGTSCVDKWIEGWSWCENNQPGKTVVCQAADVNGDVYLFQCVVAPFANLVISLAQQGGYEGFRLMFATSGACGIACAKSTNVFAPAGITQVDGVHAAGGVEGDSLSIVWWY